MMRNFISWLLLLGVVACSKPQENIPATITIVAPAVNKIVRNETLFSVDIRITDDHVPRYVQLSWLSKDHKPLKFIMQYRPTATSFRIQDTLLLSLPQHLLPADGGLVLKVRVEDGDDFTSATQTLRFIGHEANSERLILLMKQPAARHELIILDTLNKIEFRHPFDFDFGGATYHHQHKRLVLAGGEYPLLMGWDLQEQETVWKKELTPYQPRVVNYLAGYAPENMTYLAMQNGALAGYNVYGQQMIQTIAQAGRYPVFVQRSDQWLFADGVTHQMSQHYFSCYYATSGQLMAQFLSNVVVKAVLPAQHGDVWVLGNNMQGQGVCYRYHPGDYYWIKHPFNIPESVQEVVTLPNNRALIAHGNKLSIMALHNGRVDPVKTMEYPVHNMVLSPVNNVLALTDSNIVYQYQWPGMQPLHQTSYDYEILTLFFSPNH